MAVNETTPLTFSSKNAPVSVDGASSTSHDDDEGSSCANKAAAASQHAALLKMVYAIALALVAVAIACICSYLMQEEPQTAKEPNIPMPAGVNLGSWLSLEDYFFASGGAVEVATPWGRSQAACLPPLHVGTWQSETDLLATLRSSSSSSSGSTLHEDDDDDGDDSLVTALQVFHAHRISFIDADRDLPNLQQLGVQHVRVPLSWCLTDLDPDVDGITKQNAANYTCVDPFYPSVRWPAVPKAMVARFLRSCAKYGILATLDLHTYPGATSIGTFSGLWPRWPKFWLFDDPQSPSNDIGRGLLSQFIAWMESLADTDPLAFRGLHAISPMNEPAHLAGFFGDGDPKAFLPPLPGELAREFLQELQPPQHHSRAHRYTTVPDGPHLRVLLWLRDAVAAFRESKLASRGKQIHVNIHESVFRRDMGDHVVTDSSDAETVALRVIAAWWRGITTVSERSAWAVLDVHHYHAWEPTCQGSVVVGEGNYTCGDLTAMQQTVDRCAKNWAPLFRRTVDNECGAGARLASAEFSTATHHRVRHACSDATTLRAWYLAQVGAARAAEVDLYYWSYKMPYGGAFRSAWSFRQLLHLLGVPGAEPDLPQFDCGAHVVLQDEPTDDTFGAAPP